MRIMLRPTVAVWIKKVDWPEEWIQADMISQCPERGTMTARVGKKLFVRPMADLGTYWLYASIVDSIANKLADSVVKHRDRIEAAREKARDPQGRR